jgi:hypothetical protein
MTRETLAARMRRDLTQIEVLLDCGQLTQQALRDLVRSLGEEVTEVEEVVWAIEIAEAAPPAGKAAAFSALKARFHSLPGVNRMDVFGHLGVIKGGRA